MQLTTRSWRGPTRVEYIGGPRDGARQTIEWLPRTMPDDCGIYRRSGSADDHSLRYIWEAEARAEVAGRP